MGKPLRREVILSKNLILPTTTFFQYGNTSKKKQAFSVWDFQKFRLTPISEGGFGISSLPENIGSDHPLIATCTCGTPNTCTAVHVHDMCERIKWRKNKK